MGGFTCSDLQTFFLKLHFSFGSKCIVLWEIFGNFQFYATFEILLLCRPREDSFIFVFNDRHHHHNDAAISINNSLYFCFFFVLGERILVCILLPVSIKALLIFFSSWQSSMKSKNCQTFTLKNKIVKKIELSC